MRGSCNGLSPNGFRVDAASMYVVDVHAHRIGSWGPQGFANAKGGIPWILLVI